MGLDLADFEGVPVNLTGFDVEGVTMLWSLFLSQMRRQVASQLVGVALGFMRRFGGVGVLGVVSAGIASVALDERQAFPPPPLGSFWVVPFWPGQIEVAQDATM